MKTSKLLYFFACSLFVFGSLTVDGQKNDVWVSGTVEQIIIEDAPARSEYFLVSDDGRRYRLAVSKSLAGYNNRRVSLSGALDGDELNVTGDIRPLDENRTAFQPPPTFGSRKVLVILIKTIDSSTPVETVEDARANIFTGEFSVNRFFKEASLNRFRLTGINRADGDITNWLTVPFSVQNCEVSRWATSGMELARQNGFEPNNYNSLIFVFPTLCAGRVSASLGTLGDTSRTENIWLTAGFLYNVEVIAHEMGHNLGLMHASSLRCLPGNSIPNGCEQQEYGDPYDIMGRHPLFFFNNFFRLGLGWLTGGAPEVTASGDYTLVAPSAPSKGNQVLQIPLRNQEGSLTGYSYYLEFRRPFSFDNQSAPLFQPLFSGVGIRIAPTAFWGDSSKLIDTTPNTTAIEDAPLTVGKTYADAQHGLTITTLSANPQFGVRVRIQLSR